MKDPVVVSIREPFRGTTNFVGVRDIYVEQAIRRGVGLKIIVPKGSAVVDPQEWKDKAIVRQQDFKIPGKPMTLYCGLVPIAVKEKVKKEAKKPEEKNPEDDQLSLFA